MTDSPSAIRVLALNILPSTTLTALRRICIEGLMPAGAPSVAPSQRGVLAIPLGGLADQPPAVSQEPRWPVQGRPSHNVQSMDSRLYLFFLFI